MLTSMEAKSNETACEILIDGRRYAPLPVAAARAGVSLQTLQRRIKRGAIVADRHLNRVLVQLDEDGLPRRADSVAREAELGPADATARSQ